MNGEGGEQLGQQNSGTERHEQLLAERLAPDSPLLQALVKVVLSKAGSVEK